MANPVPRITHPDWLTKLVLAKDDPRKQTAISSFFSKRAPGAMMDMEDFGSSPAKKLPLVHRRRRLFGSDGGDESMRENGGGDQGGEGEGNEDKEEEAPAEPAIEVEPRANTNMSDNFEDWLKVRRESWRQLRQKKKRGRMQSGSSMVAPSRAITSTGSISDYIRSASETVSRGYWQVIEIAESGEPGKLKVWAMTAQRK